MQRTLHLNEILLQNKTLERRNEELLKLVEAWQTNTQKNKPRFIKSLDMHEIENLIIRFYQVNKVPVSIYDESGKLLFSIGWKSVCIKSHRSSNNLLSYCKESVKFIQNRMADTNSYSFKCKNEVNSIAIPISLQKESLGTLVVGQFLYEKQNPENIQMQKIAYENGFDLEEYKNALKDLPVYSEMDVEKMTEFYILFSEMISFIASRNLELQEQQTLTNQKNEVCAIFKEKLQDQSMLIQSVYQCLLQQHQEIEMLKNELSAFRKSTSVVFKEKSLVEIQPG